MNALIDILIPTYNRSASLMENLHHIHREIEQDGLGNQVRIIISDNASPDDTEMVVRDFIRRSNVEINYFKGNVNMGLEQNMLYILGKASAPFVMWTGDDDYLAKGYLSYCFSKIREIKDLGLILPGLSSLKEDGTLVVGRLESFEEKFMQAGFESALHYSHLAHQMSGLLMKREGLLEAYLAQPKYRNPYLFIYFSANRMLNHPSIYAPKYKTTITVFNKKDWGYNEVGLLDEVFKSYLAMRNTLSEEQIRDLMVRFSILHSYRYDIRWYKPLKLYLKYRRLLQLTPSLKGFKYLLARHLIKDYFLSFRP